MIGTNAIRECPQHARIPGWPRLEPPLVTRSRQIRCVQEEIKLPDGLCSFKLEDIRVRGLERLLVNNHPESPQVHVEGTQPVAPM